MGESTTYIQTLVGFGNELKSYRLQEDRGSLKSLVYFGAAGRINLFVGANNSGKSRFLRNLFKNPTFTFLSDVEIAHINNLFTQCEELIRLDSTFRFKLEVSGGNRYGRGGAEFPHSDLVPPWVSEILKYYSNIEVDEVYGRKYFESVQKHLISFLSALIEDMQGKELTEQLQRTSKLSKALSVNIDNAQTARKLLVGEIAAKKYDKGFDYYRNYDQFHSLQRWAESIDIDHIIQVAFREASEEFQDAFICFWESVEALTNATFEKQEPVERIYIPTLRSAVSLRQNSKKLEDDIFQETVCYNYEINPEDIKAKRIDVFTGNKLYQAILDDSNGNTASRRRFEDFERFLGDTFFQGRTVYVIAVSERDSPGKHIQVEVEGEGDEGRDLHNLGDGIGALVILMYRIFLAKTGSWIFIEEPELNLHPGLQRIFLQTLMANPALLERNLRVFLTTHSNHLLNVTLNQVQEEDLDSIETPEEVRPSVFAFQKRGERENFQIRELLSEQHEALALLGVSNASVLLAQCGIWVEGFTDRLYVRSYLKAYCESKAWHAAKNSFIPREDLDYAFWDYAGSNLAHYLFTGEEVGSVGECIKASAICNHIFLMADRDQKTKRRHTILTAIDNPNFVFYVTPGLEIENLIGADLLRACLPKIFRFQPKDDELPLLTFTEQDYKFERMGEFLLRHYAQHCPPALKHKDRGTLSSPYKVHLAQEVATKVTWDNMSPDAKKLTKQIYDFIARHAGHKVSV